MHLKMEMNQSSAIHQPAESQLFQTRFSKKDHVRFDCCWNIFELGGEHKSGKASEPSFGVVTLSVWEGWRALTDGRNIIEPIS